jgi:hypothetical protein
VGGKSSIIQTYKLFFNTDLAAFFFTAFFFADFLRGAFFVAAFRLVAFFFAVFLEAFFFAMIISKCDVACLTRPLIIAPRKSIKERVMIGCVEVPLPIHRRDLGGGFGEVDAIDALPSASAYQTGNRAATNRRYREEKTLDNDDHLAS